MKKALIIAENYNNFNLYINNLKKQKYEITIMTESSNSIKGTTKIKLEKNIFKKAYTIRKNIKDYDLIYTDENIIYRIFSKTKTNKTICMLNNFKYYREKILVMCSSIYITLNEIENEIVKNKIKKNTVLIRGYGIKEENYTLSLNYKNKLKEELGILKDDFVLFTNDFNNLELIKYMNDIKDDNLNIKLIINNEISKKEQELIKIYNLDGYIKVVNNKKNDNKLYAISDLYLSTNKKMSFDENLVRALNYGLPVLAFKNNGNNKMIKNNGYLVNDKISFIDRIETMYYDNKDYKINKNEVNKNLISNIVKDIEKKLV